MRHEPHYIWSCAMVIALALFSACSDEPSAGLASRDALVEGDTQAPPPQDARADAEGVGTEDTVVACTDTLDNDGDTYIDCGDADCCAVVDCTEQPSTYCGRAAACATDFGDALTEAYGRMDGIVHAVVGPFDAPCLRDDNHVIVQVDMGGATYKLWVNIESTLTPSDPQVRFLQTAHPLVGPAWSEGWHTDAITLGYPETLDAHTPQFAPMSMNLLVATLKSKILPGAPISVFAHGYTSGDGAHLIHYNGAAQDGAIVVSPDESPSYLLFQFSSQSF